MYHRTLLLFPSDEVLPSLGVYQRVVRLLRDELFGVCVCVCACVRACVRAYVRAESVLLHASVNCISVLKRTDAIIT